MISITIQIKNIPSPLKRGHFDEDDLRYIRKEIKLGGR